MILGSDLELDAKTIASSRSRVPTDATGCLGFAPKEKRSGPAYDAKWIW
jgi:hypothetical protein